MIVRFSLALALVWAAGVLPAAAQAAVKHPAPKAAQPSAASKPASKPAPRPVGIKPEERARQMTASMTQALGLAAEQVKKVQEINLLSVQRVEEARRTYARQLPQMRAEIELIGNSRLSLLKDVLTAAQFRAYDVMREQKMGIPEALKQQAALSESANGQ